MSKVVTKTVESKYEYEGMQAARNAFSEFRYKHKSEKGFTEQRVSYDRNDKGKWRFVCSYQVEE